MELRTQSTDKNFTFSEFMHICAGAFKQGPDLFPQYLNGFINEELDIVEQDLDTAMAKAKDEKREQIKKTKEKLDVYLQKNNSLLHFVQKAPKSLLNFFKGGLALSNLKKALEEKALKKQQNEALNAKNTVTKLGK